MEVQAGFWQAASERSIDSLYSTPYGSESCSPRTNTERSTFSYYSVNTPAWPVTVTCDNPSYLPGTATGFAMSSSDESFSEGGLTQDFEFSVRFSETDPSWSLEPMSTADELFFNGQIRPLWSTGEDWTHLSSQFEPHPDDDDDDDDEDNRFDFKSSADYKFSMSPSLHSSAFTMKSVQRGVGYGCSRPFHDENWICAHDFMYEVKEEDVGGEVQRTEVMVQKWKEANASQGREEMIGKQVSMGEVERSRGRRACGSKEGGVWRGRSLSPLRIFHMDDELPKLSLDFNDLSIHSIKGDDGKEGKEKQGAMATSCKERHLTLKELLHSSSRTERMPSQKHGGKLQKKPDMEMVMKMRGGRRSPRSKPSPKQALGVESQDGSNHHAPVQHQESMSPHGLHHKTQKLDMEQMKQQSFLPWRRGWLACLGFSSRGYRSVAGAQTFGVEVFHSTYGGMRWSTR